MAKEELRTIDEVISSSSSLDIPSAGSIKYIILNLRPGPDPIKILQHKFYAMPFFQAF